MGTTCKCPQTHQTLPITNLRRSFLAQEQTASLFANGGGDSVPFLAHALAGLPISEAYLKANLSRMNGSGARDYD